MLVTKWTRDRLDLLRSDHPDTVAPHHRVAAAVDDECGNRRVTLFVVLAGVSRNLVAVDDDHPFIVVLHLDADLSRVNMNYLAREFGAALEK